MYVCKKDYYFRWKANIGIYEDFEHIEIEKSSPLGTRLIEDVAEQNLSCKWVKLTRLNKPQHSWKTETDLNVVCN